MDPGLLKKARTQQIYKKEEIKSEMKTCISNDSTESSDNADKEKPKYLLEDLFLKPKRISNPDFLPINEALVAYKFTTENPNNETRIKSHFYYEYMNSFFQI